MEIFTVSHTPPLFMVSVHLEARCNAKLLDILEIQEMQGELSNILELGYQALHRLGSRTIISVMVFLQKIIILILRVCADLV